MHLLWVERLVYRAVCYLLWSVWLVPSGERAHVLCFPRTRLQVCSVVLWHPIAYISLTMQALGCITPVWSSTCSSNYLRLPSYPVWCLRVIGNHPRRTPTSHMHNSRNIQPIPVIIHRLTDKFFAHCPSHPNPLVQQIGNYTLVQCFSTDGPRPGTGPWHLLYRAARGSPGICHFSFLNIFHD
jgi:hypothetical protein